MGNAGAIRAGRAFVEFFVDDKGLRKSLDNLQSRFNAVGSKLQSLGKVGLGFGSSIIGAFGGAAAVFANAGSELFDMSKRTGLSVESLQELKYAAEQSGTSLSVVEKAVKKMQSNGIAADKFDEIAASIAAIEDPTQRAKKAMEVWGAKTGPMLLPMIENLAKTREEARRLGLVMSSDDAASADALGDSLDTLWTQLTRVVQSIGAAVAGPLTDFLVWSQEIIGNAIEWANNNRDLIQTVLMVAAGIAAAGAVVIAAGLGFQLLAFAAGGLATALGVVGTVGAALLSPLGLITAGVAGGTAAFLTMTDTGQALVQNLSAWFGELSEIVAQAFSAMSAAISAGDMQAAGVVLWSALNLLWLEGTAGLTAAWNSFLNLIADTWHVTWAGMQTAGAAIFGNLERAWSHVGDFFVESFERTTASIKIMINDVWGFFQKAWAWITGASDEEIARITAEVEATNDLLNKDSHANVAAREATGEDQRAASNAAQQGRTNSAGAVRDQRLLGNDEASKAKIAAAKAELEAARASFTQSTATAKEAFEAAKAKKNAGATRVGATIAANTAAAAGKLSTSGTFSGAAAALMQGGNVDQQLLDVDRETLATLQRIERKPAGKLVAGA